MNIAIRPPERGGFGSYYLTVKRRTGDPRSDLLLDMLSRAPRADRLGIAHRLFARLGEAEAEHPFFVGPRAQAAASFAIQCLGIDPEGDQARQLYGLRQDSRERRETGIGARALQFYVDHVADVSRETSVDERERGWTLNRAIRNAAKWLGHHTVLPEVELVDALYEAAALMPDDRKEGVERACRSQRFDRFSRIEDAEIEDVSVAEEYEIDLEALTPTPEQYHDEIAEREAAERAEADETAVQTAEAEIRAMRPDLEGLLARTRRLGRETLPATIGVLDLADRIAAQSSVDVPNTDLRTVLEVTIEVAREGRDLPYDDEARVADQKAVAIKPEIVEPPRPVPALPLTIPATAPAALSREAEIEALTHVPGLVGEIVDWMVATSRFPNRTLAFAATLVFLGTLAGRLYKSPTGFRTNLYCLGIAPSGFGKDHARKCIESFAAEGAFDKWIAGDGIASGSGMRKRVEHHASIMWKIDEFGGFMRKISDPRNTHGMQIRDNMLKYYGTAGSTFRGEDYAGEPGTPCHHPNVGIYGTSTPLDFWGSLQSLSVGDGLLARMVIFSISDTIRPEARPAISDYEQPPKHLIQKCRAVVRSKGGGNIANLMDGSRRSNPYAVPYGPGAEAYFEDIARELAERTEGADREEAPFWHRVPENAAKIALVLAIGENPDDPILTVENLRTARRIVELCLAGTFHEIKGRLADNDRQREHLFVKRLVDEAGPIGISKTELSRRINGRFDARRRDDVLKTLLEDERVIESVGFQNKQGPKGYRFVAVRHIGKDGTDG